MTDGNWCKSSPAPPSPLWWDPSEACLVYCFPEFLWRIESQSLGVVADVLRHPLLAACLPLSPPWPCPSVCAPPKWTMCSQVFVSGSALWEAQTNLGAACKSVDEGHFYTHQLRFHDVCFIQLCPICANSLKGTWEQVQPYLDTYFIQVTFSYQSNNLKIFSRTRNWTKSINSFQLALSNTHK